MKSEERLFQDEAEELFEELERYLLKLEKTPDDSGLQDRVYHLFQSIKVLSTVSGLTTVSRLAMMVLVSLDCVRDSKATVSEDFIEKALETHEQMQQMVAAFSASEEPDLSHLRELFSAWESLVQSYWMETGGAGLPPLLQSDSAYGPQKPQVLIVDDEAINRTLLEEAVRHYTGEADIVSVASAEEGLYYYFSRNFDLVFLDIMMPKITGDQFLDIVQKNRELGHLRQPANIVVQTAVQSMEQLLTYVRKECVQEIIRKPIPLDRIRECIQRYCFKRFS